jgi:MFS family permease
MNSLEWRAVTGLSLVYALRMVGMFMILPVFALYARGLPGGVSGAQIGLAIGAYGLAQALLQIPLGIASDRWGRKPVIVLGMAVFAVGSLVAASSHDIFWITVGRLIQGAGAVSSAVSALLADVTRDSVRTTAMAILGAGMGLSFILALVLGPVLGGWIGVPGIFELTGALALLSIPVVLWVVPTAPRLRGRADGLKLALGNPELLRLDGGIFLLHAMMTALFIGAPIALLETLSLPSEQHWKVYLPVLLVSIVPVFPLIRLAEVQGRLKPIFLGAIAVLAVALAIAAEWHTRPSALIAAVLVFFCAFNFLEGSLPSLISRRAPQHQKGAALGVYSSAQFLGGFAGGTLGGFALGHWGVGGVFAVAALLPLLWLSFAFRLTPTPAAREQEI